MLDLYLIRHAESDMNNKQHLICGRSNSTPLSENGFLQAELLGKRLKKSGVVFDKVYSSIAQRARDTAKKVCLSLDYPSENITFSPQILELNQGDWEGQAREKIYTPEMLNQITADNWKFTPPNGESQKDVEERMQSWLEKNILSIHPQSETIGVFTHGMAIKCLLRGIMNFSPHMTYKIHLDNTSITRLKHSTTGWQIMSINDSTYLINNV